MLKISQNFNVIVRIIRTLLEIGFSKILCNLNHPSVHVWVSVSVCMQCAVHSNSQVFAKFWIFFSGTVSVAVWCFCASGCGYVLVNYYFLNCTHYAEIHLLPSIPPLVEMNWGKKSGIFVCQSYDGSL